MSYHGHAMREFSAAGWFNDDGYNDKMQKLICEQLLELLDVFGKHGHSGSSAPYAINLFKSLANFEPITPLTGVENEWVVHEDGTKQNKRCSHVFMGNDGRAYDIEGRIFRGKNGVCYTSFESRKYVTFPYFPKREYVDVNEDGSLVNDN